MLFTTNPSTKHYRFKFKKKGKFLSKTKQQQKRFHQSICFPRKLMANQNGQLKQLIIDKVFEYDFSCDFSCDN